MKYELSYICFVKDPYDISDLQDGRCTITFQVKANNEEHALAVGGVELLGLIPSSTHHRLLTIDIVDKKRAPSRRKAIAQ